MTAPLFSSVYDPGEGSRLLEKSKASTPDDVERSLSRDRHGLADFLTLISPSASAYLEPMAKKSGGITQARFGRIVQLYIPLYLSSECDGTCLYCGFRRDRKIDRKTLSVTQALDEAKNIRAMGFSHILLVSGTAPSTVTMDYLSSVISGLRTDFSSIILEIVSLSEEQYRRLHEAGAEGVTIYQETYDKTAYALVHPDGNKRDFNWRLDAADRLCAAGMRKVNIGSLLGLHDWRFEAVSLALHGFHLMKHYWQTQLALSFPRITDHPEDFSFTPVLDRELVQIVAAFRICFPDANLVISTRERADFRMNLVRLGVTQMSAGSRTTAGGYASPASGKDGQFLVHDPRPPAEVAGELRQMGYEPVWKDWESGLS